MATCIRKLQYRCSNDCQMSGCPSHEGVLEYNSVSDTYHFTLNRREIFFERGEMQTVIDLLKSLGRADSVQIK